MSGLKVLKLTQRAFFSCRVCDTLSDTGTKQPGLWCHASTGYCDKIVSFEPPELYISPFVRLINTRAAFIKIETQK
jgi:hypothetical protein